MKKILLFLKKEPMLPVALLAAAVSLIVTPPTRALLADIDWRTLGTLFMMLTVLEGFKPKSDGEQAIVSDRLGDVYQELGRTADASRAWKRALEATEDKAGFGRLLSIKIDSLPHEAAAAAK